LRFNVVFAIDLSASMAGRRLDAAKACVDRVVSTALHPADGVGIVGFHSSVSVVLPLTPLASADVPSVLRSLTTGRQTCLWDAVLDAMDMLEGAEPDATAYSELVRAWPWGP
jgi:Mg-chelatase subunit ChlD